jgi:hypothetical protein
MVAGIIITSLFGFGLLIALLYAFCQKYCNSHGGRAPVPTKESDDVKTIDLQRFEVKI